MLKVHMAKMKDGRELGMLCSTQYKSNIGADLTTENKTRVTCARCISKMKKWGWIQ